MYHTWQCQGVFSWLHSELLLEMFRGQYGMLGSNPKLAMCKAAAFPTILSLQFQAWYCFRLLKYWCTKRKNSAVYWELAFRDELE